MTAERPTWKLKDRTYTGSFPARSIDPDAAMEAALAYKISHDRLNDVTALVKAAMGYFIESSQDALVELACKVTAGSLRAPDGWELEVLPQRSGQTAELLLRSADAGGWHIGLSAAKELTGAAHARLEELNQEINRDLDALGLTGKEMILRRIFPKGDLTPAEKAYAALEADPESYRGLQPGDRFSRGIAAHDVNLREPDFMSLAAGLVKHGYTSPERQFEANDGRHVGYAREEDFGFSVEVKTQRGMYRVDLHIEVGEMMRICAFRESGGVARPVGRFVRGADGFEEDYAGAAPASPQ